jgi:hypothetical protein
VKRQLSQKEQDRARKDRVLPDYTGDKFGRYPGAGQKLSGLGGSRGYNPMNPSSGFTRGYRYGAHDSPVRSFRCEKDVLTSCLL